MKYLDLPDIKQENPTHNLVVTPHTYALTYTHVFVYH